MCSDVSNSLQPMVPWTVAHQASLPLEFSRQEYWSGLPFPTPGDLPNPGIKTVILASPALAGGFFTNCITWKVTYQVAIFVSSITCVIFYNLIFICVFTKRARLYWHTVDTYRIPAACMNEDNLVGSNHPSSWGSSLKLNHMCVDSRVKSNITVFSSWRPPKLGIPWTSFISTFRLWPDPHLSYTEQGLGTVMIECNLTFLGISRGLW